MQTQSEEDSSSTQKPLLFLLHLLLHQDLLPLACQSNQYLPMIDKLTSEGFKHSGVSLLDELLIKLDMVAGNLAAAGPGMDGLVRVWERIAECTTRLENLDKKGSYDTVLSLLKFAVMHFSEKGSESRVWKTWSGLYQAAVAAGELAVSLDTSHVCHVMTGMLADVARSQETSAVILSSGSTSLPTGQLVAQARCAKVMIDQVELSSLARLIKSR